MRRERERDRRGEGDKNIDGEREIKKEIIRQTKQRMREQTQRECGKEIKEMK